MEWPIPVNDLLPDDITKLTSTMVPPGFEGNVEARRIMQKHLGDLIDRMGDQSAAAQGLIRVITTAEKLRNSADHTLYLLKDSTAKNGQGEVIGLLKVGHKHLFLFDGRDQVREVEPLCVLDFYVVRDRQRSGYGRVLFDYMLHDMEVSAHELAIDGPSAKMERFLQKNYEVERLMRQSNNFAVAPQFFDRFKDDNSRSGRSTPAVAAAVGRFAAPRPPSAIASVIHGGASYYADSSNGDSSDRELDRELDRSEESPAPQSEEERLPEPLPWAPYGHMEKGLWDDEDEAAGGAPAAQGRAAAGRPAELRVPPPAAPAAFADAPPAGLPSGASTPASGSGAGSGAGSSAGTERRDPQLTVKGFFDVKFYHNRLW